MHFGYSRSKRVVSTLALTEVDIKEGLEVDMGVVATAYMVEEVVYPHMFQLQ
jgi:hypothetical protein